MDELELAFSRPARSYLHSPAPIGFGTGMVESLTSYLARLANSHCVGVADLLACLVERAGESLPSAARRVYNLTRLPSRELNDMQTVARRWSNLVAEQTLRDGTDQLTLLPWRDLVTPRTITHRSQRWCPLCLDSWQTIYWPLLWSLRVVTICPWHQQPLEERCSQCQASVPALTAEAQIGFCFKCHAWLGLPTIQVKEAAHQEALTIAQGALAMLAAVPGQQHDATLDKLARLLQFCQQAANCRQIHLAHALKLEPPILYRIIARDNLVSIPTLLAILTGLGVSIHDFVTQPVEEIVSSGHMAPFVNGLPNKQKRRELSPQLPGRRATPERLAAIQAALEAAAQESPPTTLKTVAQRLGTTVKLLKLHYPQLSRQIVDTHWSGRNLELFGEYLRALLAAEETPPALSKIAEHLKTSVVTLHHYFPEEMKAILQRRQLIPDVTEFRQKVAAFLEVEPPLPLEKVALQLGIKASHIRLHCPDLRRAIVQRYADYKYACSLERKRRLGVPVREAVFTLHAQGKYPTRSKVAVMLGRRRWQVLQRGEIEAFTEAMHDLGLQT